MKKLLIACGLFLVIVALLGAQARPPASDPFAAARKALNLGQYEQVASLLASSNDPRAIALRARIDIDHGRYAEAEKLLTPAAASAPGSDAWMLIIGKSTRGTGATGRKAYATIPARNNPVASNDVPAGR